ncbi:hypothetical protein CF326_g2175 [Tilletia indica]|nr:hypothetical protein CF326_g2175 [Tilletia indica]
MSNPLSIPTLGKDGASAPSSQTHDRGYDEKMDLEKGSIEDHSPPAFPTGVGFATAPAGAHATFEDVEPNARDRRLQREKTLERTYSVDGRRPPLKVPVSARLTGDFRTMSIQLSEGGLAEARDQKKGQKQALKALSELEWHLLSVNDVLTRLGASASSGLDSDQVKRRLSQYGPNKMSKPPSPWFRKLISYVFGGFGTLLLGSAIMTMVAWKPLANGKPQASVLALAIVLFVVNAISAIFNAWQDWSTSRVMASISGMLPSDVTVIRDGNRVSVPATDLVQGDLVHLSLGQKMAADMRIIKLDGELKFDRSVLTGESDAISGSVDKTDENYLESRNVVMAGTSCVGGGGLAVVTSTGDATVFGRLAKMSSQPKKGMTTLQREIFLFVVTISTIAASLCIICIIIWAAYLRPKHPDFMSVSQLIVNVVSIAVAFIPEGLPIAVTLSLTIIANKMRQSKVLCKSLSTCETLGSITVLCADKTGTLTKNNMVAVSVAVHGFESTPSDATRHIIMDTPIGNAFKQVQFVGAVCNGASFDGATMNLPLSERKIHGDATDKAILRLAEEMHGVSAANAGWESDYTVPFNSKNKFMLKLLSTSDKASVVGAISPEEASSFDPESDLILLAKGAPDILIKRCVSVLDADGQVVPLNEARLATLENMQAGLASQGQRVLLLTRRIVSRASIDAMGGVSGLNDSNTVDLTNELCAVGLVGIFDPPRDEIPGVVKTIRGAGSRFFMVTGDFALTATSIAKQCGIITTEKISTFADLDAMEGQMPVYDTWADNTNRPMRALVLSGSDIMRMSDAHWETVSRFDEIVFARTTPEQKLAVVKCFQSRDCVVGMTGDGVNDAPALKQADLGISIIGASEVALESAALVLMDGFGSMVDAMVYGRLVFSNLKSTIAYLLPAGSCAELMAILAAFFFGLPQILSNIQMIIICALNDAICSLTLCLEKPEGNLLNSKPRNVKKDRLADWKLLLHAYVFVGLPLTVCCFSMAFWDMEKRGVPFSDMFLKYSGGVIATTNPEFYAEVINKGQSVFYFTAILMQWFNLLSIRTRRLSIFQKPPIGRAETSNLMLFPAMILSLLIGLFISYIPAIQHIFLTREIRIEYFFLPAAFGLVMISMDELRKYAVRKYPRSFLAKIAW